jgi:hypothetical protein
MDKEGGRQQGPTASRLVEGQPIRVGARELVPVVRVTVRGQRRAHVGTNELAGQGWGFVRLQPVAILERSAGGERHIPIQDRTVQALSGFLLAAFVIPLLLGVAVRLARGR